MTISAHAPTQAIPKLFLGLSTEFTTLPIAERYPIQYERVLAKLETREDGRLVLRIGGDSAEHVQFSNTIHSAPWAFAPTPALVRDTASAIAEVGGRAIIDINTITSTQNEAGAWMKDLTHSVDLLGGKIVAFEIGNEPDIYNQEAWKRGIGIEGNAPANPAGVAPADLPKEITPTSYAKRFQAYADALHSAAPTVPVIAPAIAEPTNYLRWIKPLLAHRTTNLREISVHSYPYLACAQPGTAKYPTIQKVLSENATAGMAKTVAPAVAVAHQAGLPLRLTEINSVTCGGLEGVSNTFATALWAPDALFELMKAGVEGVNLHARVTSINRPFSFDQQGLQTRPLLYGLILFRTMLGPHVRLVPVQLRTGSRSLHLKVWATRGSSSRTGGGLAGGGYTVDPLKVLMINKGHRSALIHLNLPTQYPASVTRLLARSASSTAGMTLQGIQLNHQGTLTGKYTVQTVKPTRDGSYVVSVRGESAATLTVRVAPSTLAAPGRQAAGPALFGYE